MSVISKIIFKIYSKLRKKEAYRKYIQHLRIKKVSVRLLNAFYGEDFNKIHTIYIETLTACNLRCSYCPNSVYDRGLVKNNEYMDVNLYFKIIDELAEIGWVGEIQPHSYGEPLLDERLPMLCNYTKEKLPNVIIAIFSNGELLNVKNYNNLINNGVGRFVITQHLKNESQGTLDVLKYRERYGNDNVEFEYKKLKHINSRGGLVDVNSGELRKECNYPDHHVGISYDGEIMICCNDYLNEAKVGNVSDEKIIDIWNKPIYVDIRKNVSSGNFALNICQNCTDGKVYNY